ncbi:MAG TPA: hypothetical protein VJ824_17285 [Bacillota bacterium]|nr:hypothetical protein [Bacillota bacterium]
MGNHFYSQILIGKPIEVAHGYELSLLTHVPLYVNPPFIRISLIPVGFIQTSKRGIQLYIWGNQDQDKEKDTLN